MLDAIRLYFGETNWKKLFLEGGCFWFASHLSEKIPGSELWINRVEEHCALLVGDKLYDIRGEIDKHNFHKASEREISFMKKNYVPKFDAIDFEKYLQILNQKLLKIQK